jgi:CheY-like chemotaxis protein
MTVLVVDDDPDLREVVVLAIQTEDRNVVEAGDGREALDYVLAQGLPDLILLDMNMPAMNGWEFARELHARDLWRTPIIVITAAHDAARSASEIGAAGFLGKPFEMTSLRSIVDQFLCSTRQQREGSQRQLRP